MTKRYNCASAILIKTNLLSRKLLITVAILASLLLHAPLAAATIIFDQTFTPEAVPVRAMTRGEAVSYVIKSFDIRKKAGSFIRDCLQNADDCFFVFSTMSDYDGISFSPLILYPDVFPANPHYRAINTATMLGLVHGFLEEENSPFHPEIPMTRIQALKVVLGAADLLKWKDKFELTEADSPQNLPFKDDAIGSESGWWYARYLSFALENGLIDEAESFEPDRAVSETELADVVTRTLSLTAKSDAENP
jgi:hypothetical protein